ncbi:MAG: ABC transporter ATP-binding protein [Acidobacteriota bacterium]|nr:ABC transporter ATP-binding protein [Acidobacteriota bacterium]
MSSSPNASSAIISIRALRKIYRVGKVDVEALRGVDLEVEPGDFLSIVGPSGSGKSTLFHIVGGLTPPSSGTVRVAGEDLAALSDTGRTRLRRRSVSFVFQKFNLLPNLTARDNIAVAQYISGSSDSGTTKGFTPEFQNILDLLGIANRLDHKPNALSGGEQQRVAIARATVTHPAILLADEPTGNLDTRNSDAVLEILRDLNQRLGQTILMITHNPEAAAYAHHIVHMRDGRIVDANSEPNS